MKRTAVVDGQLHLVGGRCQVCGHMTIPLRAVCPACRAHPVLEASYGPTARVESWADLKVSTDAYPAPYQVGFVVLDGGPRLFTRLVGVDSRDQVVRLAGEPERDIYWFAADETATHVGGQR